MHDSGSYVDRIIHVGDLRPAVANGVRLLLETAVVPTLLLYAGMMTLGQVAGLAAVLAWCAACVTVRVASKRMIPGTLIVAVGALVARTSVALAFSSVYVYLLQPIAGSALMALLFIGSAAVGRPITLRLAQDFVHLPARLAADRRIRRLFIQVSVLWGVTRIIDAGMNLGALHLGLTAGVLARVVLSGGLTVVSIALCAYWGWTRLRRMEDVELRMAAP
jgi:hypothetical protein